jgi:hypothetical protein
MLFPNEIWKLILSFNPTIYEQRKHCETILSYYNNQTILSGSLGYIGNREILAKLIERALIYNQCVKYLNEKDNSFKDAIREYRENGKLFQRMDDMESLVIHVWMLKFH